MISGGMSGLVLGLLISPITGALVYFGYRYILRRGGKSGLGFAAGTTAGNAIATPAVVAAADPSFQPYVATATAQVAACVLISSILAPVLASYFLKRAGELSRWSRSRRTSAPASPPK
uniref:2-keto-3-deoxygluconate permease n=1 Tax=Bordetella pertussis TaxID=520 RepID=UPI00374E22EC